MRLLRPFALLVLLAGCLWFEFAQPLTAKALVRRAEDAFDSRPARRILILGNSRTFFHDMPGMVRALADAAGDQQKLQITLDAPSGASFETLWNDRVTQGLLGERWDDVILQPESRAESSDELKQSFQTYGARLIKAAQLTSGKPELIVNWNYEARLFEGGDPDGSGRAALYADIQSGTAALADRAGARLINLGQLWGEVARSHPEIALTEDGNHPTLAGSYLFALLLYADLSGKDVGTIAYVPDGLDGHIATILKETVHDYRAAAPALGKNGG